MARVNVVLIFFISLIPFMLTSCNSAEYVYPIWEEPEYFIF